MKTELLNFDTITEYDDMLGVETLHPHSKCDKSFKSETDAAYATYFRFLCGFSER